MQDSELNELRKTIELLKKQNAVAQAAINGVINTPELTPKGDRTGVDSPALTPPADWSTHFRRMWDKHVSHLRLSLLSRQ